MIRALKLSILAVFLTVPFLGWGWEARLRPGSKAFATNRYPVGTKLEVLRDDDLDPSVSRLIAVKVEDGKLAGELNKVRRSDLHPIVFTIGGAR